jgi:hypothetical protein
VGMKHTLWSVGLLFLLVLLSNISHVVYVSEAQQEIEEDAKFRGVVVNRQDYLPTCFSIEPSYCIRIEEIIDDPNNILTRGSVIRVDTWTGGVAHPHVDQANVGDLVEVYAHCSAVDGSVVCSLQRDDHYIRRLSGQTATVTVTSTITSTVTRYTTVTSNTVTRTSTGTRTDYTTQTLVKDVTNTFTVTRTVTTTTTLTAWATHTQTVTKTMRRCEEQVWITLELEEELRGVLNIAPGTSARSRDNSWFYITTGNPSEAGPTFKYLERYWRYSFEKAAPTCPEKQPINFDVLVDNRESGPYRESPFYKSYHTLFELDLTGFPGDRLTITLGRTKEDRLIVKKVGPSLVVKTAQDLEITVVSMEESRWNWCGPPLPCGGRTYYYTVAVRNKSDKYQIALMDVGVNLRIGYNWKVTNVEIVKQPDHGGDIKKFLDQLVTIYTIQGFGETVIQFYNLLGIKGIPVGLFTAAAQQALNIPPEPVPDYSDVEHRFAVTLTAHGGQKVPMWLGPREEAHFKFAIQETEYKKGRWIKPVFTATYFEVMHIVKIKGWPDLALWANYIFALNWNEVGQLQVASTRAPQPIPTSSSWSGKTEVKLQETGHKLYLHVYDDLNRHVGYNRETGQVEIGIPGSQYYDHQNGTIVILLPSGVFISSVRVDAGDAKEPREEYSLVVSTVDGMQVVDRKEVRGVIDKGRVVEYRVEASSDGKVVVATPPPWYVSYWPVFAIAAVAAVAIAFRGRLRTRQRKKLVVRESGKGGELTVIDKLSGRRYTLGIFEENTAKDVIDTLIERGLIKPTPEEGYQWALTDRSGSVISPAERLSSRLPEREVFLVARPVGGKRSEDRIELTVIHKRAGKRYTLEVFKDNTAGDVIDALIESGLIKPSPGVCTLGHSCESQTFCKSIAMMRRYSQHYLPERMKCSWLLRSVGGP